MPLVPPAPHLRPLYAKISKGIKDPINGLLFSHYTPFIEAIDSQDASLLEITSGGYAMSRNRDPDHPDVILIENKHIAIAKKDNPPPPNPPSFLSREEILEDYKLLYDVRKNSKSGTIRQTVISLLPQFARAPLESLLPVPISKLMLDNVHEEHYLICRTISPAVHLVAIQVAVEDQNGDVVDLALYNCFETAGVDHLGITEILPVGQVILVRQPLLKPSMTGENPTIRVDTPSDISLLEHNDPMLQAFPDDWKTQRYSNADTYKSVGNESFKKRNFEGAIRAYTTGLAIDPSASLLRLNRSMCHLKLGNLSLALKDAQAAWEDKALPDNSRQKARYRMASIFYAMERFAEALQILKDESIGDFSPEDVESLRKKTQERILEQTQGSYDWFSLTALADQINGRRQIPDVADYIGPVKVIQMSDKGGGRGVVTTRPVKAGELLIVSKPYAFASPFEFLERLRAMSSERNRVIERSTYEVIGRAMRRLMGDHTAAGALLLDLYPGADYTPLPLPETTPPFPTFLASGIHHWTIPGEYVIPHVDFNQVEGIISNNSFSNPIKNFTLGQTEAIYLLPSLVNHSCQSTASREIVGSVLVMRASRDLKEGEEVTVAYAGDECNATYLTREPALKRWLQGPCGCELCLADREDGVAKCREREKYALELTTFRQTGGAFILRQDGVWDLVAKLRSTYRKERTAPKDVLALAEIIMAHTIQALKPEAAVETYIAGLRSYGIRVKDVPPVTVPRVRSQLQRDALIIETTNFPPHIALVHRCVLAMAGLAFVEDKRANKKLSGHWAVACFWTNETFYGPGKEYLWRNLELGNATACIPALKEHLKRFE